MITNEHEYFEKTISILEKRKKAMIKSHELEIYGSFLENNKLMQISGMDIAIYTLKKELKKV